MQSSRWATRSLCSSSRTAACGRWGNNQYGQLGPGSSVYYRTHPTQLGTAKDWKSVAAGTSHALALETNGTLWAWGINDSGQLGLGDIDKRFEPVRVGADSNWDVVGAGPRSSFARRPTGRYGHGGTTHTVSSVSATRATEWSQPKWAARPIGPLSTAEASRLLRSRPTALCGHGGAISTTSSASPEPRIISPPSG